MNKINKLQIALMIVFFVTVIVGIRVYAVTGTVNENVVYVRKSATTDSNILTYVTKDDKVEVIEKDGDWYKIKYNGTTGYIYSKYINVDESKVEPAEVETTASSETNIENSADVDIGLHIEKETDIKIIPNITSTTIYTSEEQIEISIIEPMGEWSFVKVQDITGWVKTNKIKEENAVESPDKQEENEETETEDANDKEKEEISESSSNEKETKKAYVAYDMVNLRESASTSSKSLAKLKLNDELSVIKEENSTWTKVEYGDITGFVSTSLISSSKVEEKEDSAKESSTTSRSGEESARKIAEEIEKEESEAKTSTNAEEEKNTSSNSVTGKTIADYAQKFLGKDYVYGGTSPSTGFDCSGLTYYVYKQFGYKLNRSAAGQASNGKEVAKSDLQPGDLVIFKNHALTKIGHVGIYIGNNKMIHASEPGVGVIITDIDSKAYKYPQRYVTARRLIC